MLRTLADRTAAPPDPRRSTEAEDVALIGRVIARGELAAFEAFYRGYHARLRRFIGLMTPQPAIVEEVLNDTMLVVWKRAATFNGQSKVSTWLFAIAYRTALKALRGRDEPVEEPEADAAPRRGSRGPEQRRAGRRGAGGAGAGAGRSLARAAQRPRPHLLPRPAVCRDRADRRLPGRHGEDARVPRPAAAARAAAGEPEDWL